MNSTLERLNAGNPDERLAALEKELKNEKCRPDVLSQYANNHIHTIYSFSPYSPTAAVWFARAAGLGTAGIMDHDSIAGAREFTAAGEMAGVATTIGLECRVSVDGTPLEGRKINNPDQCSVAYMALHGVPHMHIDYLNGVFAPLRERRNERNRKMVENINREVAGIGITLDFERDVLPLSQFSNGGSVTERHLLFALALRLIDAVGKERVADVLENALHITLSAKQKAQLTDTANPFFEYDLLGLLKAALVERIYVEAHEECLHISQLAELAKKTDSIFCYAYLGDVGDSVTGDKRAQKFEDSYLDELVDVLKSMDIGAITYMPSRNTKAQLERLQKLCRDNGIFEISGEDINSPRQKFICEQLALPQFSHLIDATWELIRREREKSK